MYVCYKCNHPQCPCFHLPPSPLPLPTILFYTLRPSFSGAPSFSKYAPWRYRVEYSIDNVVQQTEDTPNTFFSRSQLTAGNAFTIRVIAEGQQGYSRTSPRFTVVTQSKGMGQSCKWCCCVYGACQCSCVEAVSSGMWYM